MLVLKLLKFNPNLKFFYTILMNNSIDKAVRLLLDDNDFVDNIKSHIIEISKDGKLDFTDTISYSVDSLKAIFFSLPNLQSMWH